MRSKAIRSLLIITLILFCYNSGLNSQKGEFKFIQVTDPQFGMISNNKNVEGEIALYQKAIDQINRIKPAFVILTGDLVNDKDNSIQWEEFRKLTARINKGIKVYYSPGNHDIGPDPKKEDIVKFSSMFGSDRFSFTYKKCRLDRKSVV